MVDFKHEAAANLILALAPLLFGVLVVVVGPRPLWGMALFIIGFGCLVSAKVSNFRKGIWVSFGSKAMTKHQALLYRMGYLLMLLGYFGILSAAALKMMTSH